MVMPPLHEDFYTAGYEPTALLEEWCALHRQYTALQKAQQNSGSPSPLGNAVNASLGRSNNSSRQTKPAKHHSHSSSLRSSSKRQPHPPGRLRDSPALEQHYASRRQQQHHQQHGMSGSSNSSSTIPLESSASSPSSSSSSSSTSSTDGGRPPRRSTRGVYRPLSDPYDRDREIARQEQFMSESKRLAQPFVPAASNSGLPTRLLLGDCVRDLYRCIQRDWPATEPTVTSTAEDLIVVYFSLYPLKKRQAATVLEYMNSFAKCNETVCEFRLCKVTEGWDVLTDDAHLMYTFRPPWVRKAKRFLPDTVNPARAHVL